MEGDKRIGIGQRELSAKIYKALKETKTKYTYQFYTGEIPKKGYAVAFDELKITKYAGSDCA